MAAKRPKGGGPTGLGLLLPMEGWRFTRGDPLCRLRRHLPLEGGDCAQPRSPITDVNSPLWTSPKYHPY
jgi:hypothetical protein